MAVCYRGTSVVHKYTIKSLLSKRDLSVAVKAQEYKKKRFTLRCRVIFMYTNESEGNISLWSVYIPTIHCV